jgi:hypothetical protein
MGSVGDFWALLSPLKLAAGASFEKEAPRAANNGEVSKGQRRRLLSANGDNVKKEPTEHSNQVSCTTEAA